LLEAFSCTLFVRYHHKLLSLTGHIEGVISYARDSYTVQIFRNLLVTFLNLCVDIASGPEISRYV
jgi:hypothetical protein